MSFDVGTRPSGSDSAGKFVPVPLSAAPLLDEDEELLDDDDELLLLLLLLDEDDEEEDLPPSPARIPSELSTLGGGSSEPAVQATTSEAARAVRTMARTYGG